MRGFREHRRRAALLGLIGAAPVIYLLTRETSGPWLALLHLALAVGVLTRRFWVRWLVLGAVAGDLVLGLARALEPERPPPGPLLLLLALWCSAMFALSYGAEVARAYDGQGAWQHRLGVGAKTARGIQLGFLGIGFASPLVVELVAHHLPESRRPELAWSALVLIAIGAFGLLRQRTWSLSALSTAAALLAAFAISGAGSIASAVSSGAAAASLGAVVVAFARPIYRAWRQLPREHAR